MRPASAELPRTSAIPDPIRDGAGPPASARGTGMFVSIRLIGIRRPA
jgi:hypothetical protein